MRIGELSQRSGASVRSLRYYEEQGLLISSRSASGQRQYAESDVARVQFLRRMLAAGLSSRTIAAVLPCVDSPSSQATEAAWERMVEERAKLDAHIAELVDTRARLDELIAINRRYHAEESARSA